MSGVQDSHNPSDYFGAITLGQQIDMWLSTTRPNLPTTTFLSAERIVTLFLK